MSAKARSGDPVTNRAPAKLTTNRFTQALATNAVLERQVWLKRLLDPRRDIDYECGHPEVVTVQDYKKLFTRGDIATRVVTVLPEESWSDRPEIYETADSNQSEFEKAWAILEKQMKVFSIFERADILSGIGRYGVILLGFDDGKPLNQPIEGINEAGEKVGDAKHNLLYLRTFDESLITISTVQSDLANPRYGQPTMYQIRFEEVIGVAPVPLVANTQVHWSRIIHLADNRMDSDVFGMPRMERVLNRLLDVKKIAGGSAEMFWKGGFPGISLEAQPGAEELIDFDAKGAKEELEAYMNGMQRYLATVGMQAKSLSVQVADPTPHLETQIRLVSMALGVPWRVFMGSEAAQLASEQDIRSWGKRLTRRREGYLTPYVITPFMERLFILGTLPQPAQLSVNWPDIHTPSDQDVATVAQRRTAALKDYVQNGVDTLIPPFYYLTLVLGLEDEDARMIIEDAGSDILKLDTAIVPPASTSPKPDNALPVNPSLRKTT